MAEEKILQKLEQHDQKFDAILGKLGEHDNRFEQQDQKLAQHDQKFDVILGKLGEHDKKLEQHDQKFAQHDQKFEVIIGKLVDHDEQLKDLRENMMTKDDGRQIMDTLESIATTVQRLDQERIFTVGWVKRIEDRVEQTEKDVVQQKEDIQKMKVQLKLA